MYVGGGCGVIGLVVVVVGLNGVVGLVVYVGVEYDVG